MKTFSLSDEDLDLVYSLLREKLRYCRYEQKINFVMGRISEKEMKWHESHAKVIEKIINDMATQSKS